MSADILHITNDDDWLDRVRRAREKPSPASDESYDHLEEVAAGAQGVVYRARRKATNRILALKKLRAGSFASPEARRRFEREMEILTSLHHQHIVGVLGVEYDGSSPILVMEWVDGAPVTEWAKDRYTTKNGTAEILMLFLQICDGLTHAHLQGVIHRDLKPSNILTDSTGAARILDFGLAKRERVDPLLTKEGGFVGTPAYAAPEQFASRAGDSPVDARADIYSLGVVLFEMLTMRLPFDAGAPIGELLEAIEHRPPPRPSQYSKWVGRDLDRIILKSLAKDPAHRYQSVDAMAADVRRYRSNEPIQAAPPGFLYYFSKLIARNPKTSLLSAAAILLAFVFILLTIFQSAWLARESQSTASLLSVMLEFVDAANPASFGRDARVLDVLENKLSEIEHKFPARPDVLASIYTYSGHTYLTLGKLKEAEIHLKRAREYQYSADPRGAVQLAHIDCLLGECYHQRGEPERARELFESALAAQAADPARAPIAHTLLAFGKLEFESGNYDNAAARAAAAGEIRRRRFGEKSTAFAECLLLEAWSALGAGRPADAEKLASRTLQIVADAASDRHPLAAQSQTILGAAAMAAGALDRAEQCLQLAIDADRAALPTPHLQTAGTLYYFARLRQMQQKPEARVLANEAASMIRAVRGECDPRLAELDRICKL